MKVLVIGAGVIGTIYGYVLAGAGNDVTHYVRPGKKASLEKGIDIRLLDGREKRPVDHDVHYNLNVVEDFSAADGYGLILVSVRHYQMESVLPLLKEKAGKTDILFFNGNWEGLDCVDAYLPRSQYLWGFPVAGGGYNNNRLDAALLEEVRLGEINGQPTARLERVSRLFEGAGLKVDSRPNILEWLWVHFAINCGVIGAACKAGGAMAFLNNVSLLRQGIKAGREALRVCEARGVDINGFEDAKSFCMPAFPGAVAVWLMMKTNGPARKIMERHTAVDELQRMYFDLLKTADELGVEMPVYKSFKPYVENPTISQ